MLQVATCALLEYLSTIKAKKKVWKWSKKSYSSVNDIF